MTGFAAPALRDRGRELRLADLAWIALFVAVLIGSGIGLRDPWPADEPRFASLARDMVASGDWLIPRVGGDLYQDKPPLFFWLLALCYAVTGSVRASFLLPSVAAAFAAAALLYDIARRLHGREAGLAAALTLVCSLQFVQTMRGAQIDPTLLGLTTFSLWALLRHLLLGPEWRWCFAGGVAAGLGVITKGVGFLPLLLLALYPAMRRAGWQQLMRAPGGWRWTLVPAGFLLAVGVWLVPMLVRVAAAGTPELIAYRDEILFQQTVERYATAWHHVRPWWYFLVEVIPPLWLPGSALLFWLVPRWRDDWRARRASVWLPLGWVLLVLLFFSASAGKRGVYLLPALPAFLLAAAPHLPALFARVSIGRLSLGLAAVLTAAAVAFAGMAVAGDERVNALLAEAGLDGPAAAVALGGSMLLAWLLCAWRRPLFAWPAVIGCLAVCWGVLIAPAMNPVRSSSAFMARALALTPADRELALVAYKEQFLLYLDRETFNFGHRRWREGDQEGFDAAAWLAADPARRTLLLPDYKLERCFAAASRRFVGVASEDRWYLVSGQVSADCVARGDAGRAIRYPAHPIG
jgi:4-amino-4-deoxy-L-arabinose transferase-like glycosyltransferase